MTKDIRSANVALLKIWLCGGKSKKWKVEFPFDSFENYFNLNKLAPPTLEQVREAIIQIIQKHGGDRFKMPSERKLRILSEEVLPTVRYRWNVIFLGI